MARRGLALQCVWAATVVALVAPLARAEFADIWRQSLRDVEGREVAMSEYAETPVILVVNVASQCGFTDLNYRQLQQLHERYGPRGLQIMALPCNQFGNQEPGTNAQILEFAKNEYGVTFPIFSKADVNGANQNGLIRVLKQESGDNSDVEWNFSKFLVFNTEDRREVVRFAHTVNPTHVEADIRRALRKVAEREHARQVEENKFKGPVTHPDEL